MKVLNLQCGFSHSFEGWFASETEYLDQQEKGLLTCPLCGDAAIQKLLSAPRLNLKAGRERAAPHTVDAAASAVPAAQSGGAERVTPPVESVLFQARLVQAMREVLSQTEDVGERFADQARGMHHGDIAPRGIRGQASPEVARELVEEGIDVMALPAMPGLKDTLQ